MCRYRALLDHGITCILSVQYMNVTLIPSLFEKEQKLGEGHGHCKKCGQYRLTIVVGNVGLADMLPKYLICL